MPESAAIPVYRSAAEAAAPLPQPDPPVHDPSIAVARCCAAYQRALDAARGSKNSRYPAWAYLDAMPHFTGPDSIRDFIACVARAIALEIDSGDFLASLLDAATLALDAIPRPVRPVGRPPKSAKKPLPEKVINTLTNPK